MVESLIKSPHQEFSEAEASLSREESDTERHQRLGHGAFWSMLGQASGQGLSLVLFLVIARFVSKESFGVLAVSLALIEFVRRMTIDPIALAVNADPHATDRDYDACFTLIISISVALTAAIFSLAGPIATLIGSPGIADALRAVSVIMLAMGLWRTHEAWLARHLQFRALALRSVISVTAGGVVGIWMAVKGFGVWSLVGQQLTIAVVAVTLLWAVTPWRPRLVYAPDSFRKNLRQSRFIAISAFWNNLSNDADIFFISSLSGSAAAGAYNAGKRILLAANLMLVNSISAVTLPALSGAGSRTAQQTTFIGGIALTSALTAPAFMGLAVTAPAIVAVILGPEWHDVGLILTALALSGYLLSLSQFATSVLLVEQRSGLDSICSAIATVLSISAFILFARFGAPAVAISVSATALIIFPLRAGLAMRLIAVRPKSLILALLPSLIAAAAMGGILLAATQLLEGAFGPLGMLIALLLLGVGAYALALTLLAPSMVRMISRTALAMVAPGKMAAQGK